MIKQLFYEYNHPLDYDYHIIFNEGTIMSKKEPIKLDSEYVNDYIKQDIDARRANGEEINDEDIIWATEDNIKNFRNHPIFKPLKADMLSMVKDIATDIKSLFKDDIVAININGSDKEGISTYMTVTFAQPTLSDYRVPIEQRKNPKFLNTFLSGQSGLSNGLQGEFNLIFRLSSHPGKWFKADINIDVAHHVYDYFHDKVIRLVKERYDYIWNAWTKYCKDGKLPKKQAERNHFRANCRNKHIAQRYESLQKIRNIQNYLDYCNCNINNIIRECCNLYGNSNILKYYNVLNENIVEYALTPNFNYSLLYEDIKKCMDENLVTDLKNLNIKISQKAINSIPYDIDIQNSNVQKINISKYQDLKGTFTLLVDNNEVIAIYNKDRFAYNPNRLKMSDVINYDIYEVINNKGPVNDLRNQRQLSRQGYTDLRTSNASYNKPPKSVRYVMDRDWNAEASKEYYTKLLHQNRLGKYAEQLEYAYTVIEDMIIHRRKEQTVGKKAVYTDWINKLTSKINAAELQMDALYKNVNIDISKLIKSLNALDKVVKDASKFIGYEDDAIATFGYTKQRPHAKIGR